MDMFLCILGYNRGVSGDEHGPLHLHISHHTRRDLPSDGDITSKGTFLVNVGAPMAGWVPRSPDQRSCIVRASP